MRPQIRSQFKVDPNILPRTALGTGKAIAATIKRTKVKSTTGSVSDRPGSSLSQKSIQSQKEPPAQKSTSFLNSDKASDVIPRTVRERTLSTLPHPPTIRGRKITQGAQDRESSTKIVASNSKGADSVWDLCIRVSLEDSPFKVGEETGDGFIL
jgi:hypothetical protein